jgi:hypothetical protein
MKKLNLTLLFTLVIFSSTLLSVQYREVYSIVENGIPVISGEGQGSLSCIDGTTYESVEINFMTTADISDTERFGKLQFNYQPIRDEQSGIIDGVFNKFETTSDEDKFKLRTEFQSNICGNSDLLYLGDIEGQCGEDVTINLDGGPYLSGSFSGTINCREVEPIPPGEVMQPTSPPEVPTEPPSDVGQGVDEIDKIRDILQKITETYQQGDYDEAAVLAIMTYTSNFMPINDHLQEVDETLSKNIDDSLGHDLRQSIKERAPLSVVQQLIGTINNNLDIAEQLL